MYPHFIVEQHAAMKRPEGIGTTIQLLTYYYEITKYILYILGRRAKLKMQENRRKRESKDSATNRQQG